MKNIRYYIPLLFAPLFSSCGDMPVYLPEGDEYVHVYLLQAAKTPHSISIYMVDEVQTANYGGYYSGLNAPKDIHVTFEIDMSLVDTYNADNNTSFLPMPEGSYEIGATEGIIPAGKGQTKLFQLSLYSFGFIEAFEQYLLPLVMKTDSDVKLSEDLSVAYFQITASYEPGNVPYYEAYSGIEGNFPFFSFNDKCLLNIDSSGNLLRYTYDSATQKFNAPTTVRTGWRTVDVMVAGGRNTAQVRDNGNIQTYQLNEDATVIPAYGAVSGTIFGGLGDYYRPIGNGKNTGLLMIAGGSVLNYYGLNEAWTAYAGPQVGSSYNLGVYDIIFLYGTDLIGIDSNGDMWRHTYSTSSHMISASPTKIGSGWDDFTHVTAYGTDLLARSEDGTVRLYEFDMRGFWALKE